MIPSKIYELANDFKMAQHFQIKEIEICNTKVNLKTPRSSIESLESIIDDKLTENLERPERHLTCL
ncbi:MAG: hypothetical protein COA79_01545 [Planctomycetota bacterium]|nr:MAG: hypothetical protein COA79_01545 [Planctomycetota bacterium]